jgi:dolichyl-phosphate beta-glucosyltransferase
MIEKLRIRNGVVLPMFNERYRFSLEKLSELSKLLIEDSRILIIDDGSKDNFVNDIDEFIQTNQINNVSILRLPLNVGKATAIKVGFKELISEFPNLQYLSFADSDFSAPPSEIVRLIDVAESLGSDVVCGSRMNIEGRFIEFEARRYLTGRVFANLIKLTFKLKLYDSQCGNKVFKNSSDLVQVLALPTAHRWLLDIELMTRLRASNPNLKIWEEPLLFWTHKGDSKIKFRDILNLFHGINKLYRSL